MPNITASNIPVIKKYNALVSASATHPSNGKALAKYLDLCDEDSTLINIHDVLSGKVTTSNMSPEMNFLFIVALGDELSRSYEKIKHFENDGPEELRKNSEFMQWQDSVQNAFELGLSLPSDLAMFMAKHFVSLKLKMRFDLCYVSGQQMGFSKLAARNKVLSIECSKLSDIDQDYYSQHLSLLQ